MKEKAAMAETEGTPEDTGAAEENGVDTENTDNVHDAQGGEAADEKLGEGGKRALARERDARAKAEKELNQLKAQLKQIEDREKSELQKALERAEEAEKKYAKELRARVAAVKGVPARSLTGETEEELLASADDLIAWRDGDREKDQKKQAPPKRPQTGGGLKSGASGDGNSNSDPKARAAEALRRLRQGG